MKMTPFQLIGEDARGTSVEAKIPHDLSMLYATIIGKVRGS